MGGSCSHLWLSCGNQSSLEKVSTNALPAPGIIDSRIVKHSVGPLPRHGRALMPVTLKCLSHPPRPGCRLSCVCLCPQGDELQSLWDLKPGVMGVLLRAGAGGSSGTVTWPPGQVREAALGSVVPGNGLSGFIPKPCPSQSDYSPESQRGIHTAWTICQIPRHSRRTCDSPLCGRGVFNGCCLCSLGAINVSKWSLHSKKQCLPGQEGQLPP